MSFWDKLFLSGIKKFPYGSIEIEWPNGKIEIISALKDGPKANLKISDNDVVKEIINGGSVKFAELYMNKRLSSAVLRKTKDKILVLSEAWARPRIKSSLQRKHNHPHFTTVKEKYILGTWSTQYRERQEGCKQNVEMLCTLLRLTHSIFFREITKIVKTVDA